MERPILFNTAMVEAILAGRKTQTRRLVKKSLLQYSDADDDGLWIEDENGEYFRAEEYAPVQPGDKLYVRETWTAWSRTEGIAPKIYYKADGIVLPGAKWRPSIHMPKAAARIWLRVKDVRCERLQDITIDGVKAEGTKIPEWFLDDDYNAIRDFFGEYVWNPTVEHTGSWIPTWNANPWVWVIEFERIEGPTP